MKPIILTLTLLTLSLSTLGQDTTALERKVMKMALEIEAKLIQREFDDLNSMIDFDALLSFVEMDSPEMSAGFRDGIESNFNLWEEIYNNALPIGHYTPIHVYTDDEGTKILFRLVDSQFGVNYHEFFLNTSDTADIRISDIYVFVFDLKVSSLLEESFQMAVAQFHTASEEKSSNYDQLEDMKADIDKFREASSLFQIDNKQALKLIEELRPPVSTMSFVQSFREDLSAVVYPMQYTAEMMERFNHLDSIDNRDFTALFTYFQTQCDTARLRRTIDEFDRRVDHDEFLQIYRIDCYLIFEDYENAVAVLERVERSGADNYTCFFYRVYIALLEKDYEAAMDHLDDWSYVYYIDQSIIEASFADFPEFLESDDLKTWIAESTFSLDKEDPSVKKKRDENFKPEK